MKKILFAVIMILAGLSINAQNYETIKLTLSLTQYEKAKEDLDKQMSNAKFTSKPEAYILKASIYAGLAMNDKNRGNAEGDRLMEEANAAFAKFKEMDPSMALLKEGAYQNGIDNLYRANYNSGYNDYTAKKWDAAYLKLKKAVDYSDLLIEKNIMAVPIDTNLMILAGVVSLACLLRSPHY